jgi:hypothetical protein
MQFHMTITVNYKDGTERTMQAQSYSSEWAMQDHISQLLREQKDATSFVLVIARK